MKKIATTRENLLSGNLSVARRFWEIMLGPISFLAALLGIVVLGLLLYDIFKDGFSHLSWEFITSFPSRNPQSAGILSALVGSLWIIVLTAIIALPISIGAALYLEEYARKGWLTNFIEVNIANLAAVPSIIYGLLGLQIFVRFLFPLTNGRSIISGALTMSLLILPMIIMSAREALRTVPNSLRQAGLALGASKWQVIRHHVLPQALPGILTGSILALSRAMGETAPLIMIGALSYIAYLPPSNILEAVHTPFTVLPIQIFNWISRPQQGFHQAAAAGIIVLLGVLIAINSLAIILRNHYQRRVV